MLSPLKRFKPVRSFQRKPYLWSALLVLALLTACSDISKDIFKDSPSEGIIEYSVSFPHMADDDLMASMMPEKATMYFKNNKFATMLKSMGGVFKDKLIANKEQNKVDHMMKVFKKQVHAKMGPVELKKMLNNMGHMTLIKTTRTDSIAGFECKKALGVFDDPERSEIAIYYTRDIDIDNPNWCTPYKELDGVLMNYELEQYGMRMRLEAENVERTKVKSNVFVPDSTYKNISVEAMEVEVRKLLASFNI